MSAKKEQQIIKKLLSWYENSARDLPWRYDHDDLGNPYHTWLSEIMLQQTTVVTVRDYFHRFIEQWPTLEDLAKASEEEILTAWQGLGYYSRARNLLKCAQIVRGEYKGLFPQDIQELLKLPGVGPYTASAIASIAFKGTTVPVDGNVIRVMARLHSFKIPLPDLKKDIERLVVCYGDTPKPGNFAQGLMDLGATVCKPKKPLCKSCPFQENCCAYATNLQQEIPYKRDKPQKPTRFGKAFLITDHQGCLLIRKRPGKGLLAHMMEVPSTIWSEDREAVEKSFEELCGEGKITSLDKKVKHTFTHFHLNLDVYYGGANDFSPRCKTTKWVRTSDLHHYPLPTLMKKVIKAGVVS